MHATEGEPTSSSSTPVGGDTSTQSSASEFSTQEQSGGLSNHFYVRAGVFEKPQDAEDFAAKLRNRGFVSAYAEAETSEAGTRRYVVLLGPWIDRDSATRTMNELRNEGVSNVTIVGQR
jgi:cell division protein FtsN